MNKLIANKRYRLSNV